MRHGTASDLLVRFVERVQRNLACRDRELTVADLKVQVLAERLTEISDWPSRDLDLIEDEGASHGDHTPLAVLLGSAAASRA